MAAANITEIPTITPIALLLRLSVKPAKIEKPTPAIAMMAITLAVGPTRIPINLSNIPTQGASAVVAIALEDRRECRKKSVNI